jgi:hypothetical protein
LTSVAQASTLFSEDLESYAAGSDIVGQGGWLRSYGSAPVKVNNLGPLSTSVIDGINSITPGAQNIILHPIAGGLPTGEIAIASFDAYATSSGSFNSWAGLSGGGDPGDLDVSIVWDFNLRDIGGWGLEIRQYAFGISPITFAVPGGANLPAKFTIDIDPLLNQAWGTYDYGSGPIATPHFSVAPGFASALGNFNIGFDWRGAKGIQVDNIVVRTPDTVPLPATPTLLLIGWAAMLSLRQKISHLGR